MISSQQHVTGYIGLGSNLGHKGHNLRQALTLIKSDNGIELLRLSPLYSSPAREITDQPDFLNAVAEFSTPLDPEQLLNRLLQIETVMGRVRSRPRGPRVIDLDLLLFGDIIRSSPDPVLPHPRISDRDFVIYPLADLSPDLIIPGTGMQVRRHVTNLQDDGTIKRLDVSLVL